MSKDNEEKNEAKPAVRTLTIEGGNRLIAENRRWAVEIIGSEKKAAVHGEAIVKQLKGQVDFTKEKVVLVRWMSGGSPFDTVGYKLKKGEGGHEVIFSLNPPTPPVRGRGDALKRGASWYAVPRAIKATPTPAEEKK